VNRVLSGVVTAAALSLAAFAAGCPSPATSTAAKPSWFKSKAGQQLEPLERNVRDWEAKMAKVREVNDKLKADEAALVQKLRAEGVNSPEDLKGKPKAQVFAEDLQRLGQELAAVENKYQELDLAVTRGRSMIDTFERALLVKPILDKTKELEQLSAEIKKIDQKLGQTTGVPPAVQQFNTEEAVKRALTKYQ
jgi:hypothetical protein